MEAQLRRAAAGLVDAADRAEAIAARLAVAVPESALRGPAATALAGAQARRGRHVHDAATALRAAATHAHARAEALAASGPALPTGVR